MLTSLKVRARVLAMVCVGAASGAGVAACPSPPPGFMGSASAPCTALVSWGAAAGATGYRLWRSPVNQFSGAAQYPDLGPGTLSISDSVVVAGQTYYYWIATLTGSTVSCPSGVGPVAGPAAVAVTGGSPGAPTGVNQAMGCRQVMLTWTTGLNVTTYDVLAAPAADVQQAHVIGSAAPDASGTTGFAATVGSPIGWYYWVRAINSCGTGPLSAPIQGYMSFNPPSNVSNFAATVATRCDGIALSWQVAVSGERIVNYLYRRTLGAVNDFVYISGDQTSYLDTTAAPGVVYSVSLTPINGCGGGTALVQATASRSITTLVVSAQPASVLAQPHGDAAFSAAVGGPGSPAATAVWRKNGVGLQAGPKYTFGPGGWSVTVHDVMPEDAAVYDCVFGGNLGGGCGVTSAGAVLGVSVACRADFNLSGVLSVQDLFDYLAAYFAGCP